MRYIVTIEPAKEEQPKPSFLAATIRNLAIIASELIHMVLAAGAVIVLFLILANAG